MATIDIDTILHVYRTAEDTQIGLSSKYVTTEHPGSNKKIEGWKWDERIWPTDGEFDAAAHAPSIWDPSISGLDDDYLQAGYGDNRDLLLLDIDEIVIDDTEIWVPTVHHGFFYTYGDEWYLYSDAHLTEFFTVTGVEDSQQVLTLSREYKPTIPIQVRSFKYNRVLARHEIYRDFRKKVEFSDSPIGPEFILDTSTNPPKLILDDVYDDEIGIAITLTSSGTADPDDVVSLDTIGISDGEPDQTFLTTYSPIDPDSTLDIWTWGDPNYPLQWTIIDPIDDFTVGSGLEVKVDRERGIVTFGDYDIASATGNGGIPTAGYRVGAHYTVGTEAKYEPADTTDEIQAHTADVNPIQSSISRGFIQVNTDFIEPAAVTLTANLTLSGSFYQIELGNNTGQLTANVVDATGSVVNGQQVYFEILDPIAGTFGANQTTTVAATDGDGDASVLYVSPLTIDEAGNTTIEVFHSGSDSVVSVIGLTVPTSLDNLYLYKVHESDEVLGIRDTDLDDYYTDYLDEQGITAGTQATQDYEVSGFREVYDLGTPTVYTDAELGIGKKTIVLTASKTDVMNPHTGSISPSALAPLNPSSAVNTGTTTEPVLSLEYSNVTLDLPGTGDTKAYFIVGNSTTRVRAYVTKNSGEKIYSNTISLEIGIPDAINGTYYSQILSDIPDGLLTAAKNIGTLSIAEIEATSGIDSYYKNYMEERIYVHVSGIHESYAEWFTRTKRGDTLGLLDLVLSPPDGLGDPTYSGLETVIPQDSPAEIPVGFRLRSTGVTIASALDQVTYIDLNDNLPDGYWE